MHWCSLVEEKTVTRQRKCHSGTKDESYLRLCALVLKEMKSVALTYIELHVEFSLYIEAKKYDVCVKFCSQRVTNTLNQSTFIARLAQSVEHQTLNLRVVGSSPTLGEFLYGIRQHSAKGKILAMIDPPLPPVNLCVNISTFSLYQLWLAIIKSACPKPDEIYLTR